MIVEQADSYLEQWGMSILTGYFQIDPAIVKMGIGAYLCPFLALLAFLFMGIKKKKTPAAPSPYPARRAPAQAERSAAAKSAAPKSAAPQSSPQETDAQLRTGWICPRCSNRLTDRQAYCDACGTKRPETVRRPNCPRCGAQVSAGAAFCSSCGMRLGIAAAGEQEERERFRLPDT